jgi:hypothetical protein
MVDVLHRIEYCQRELFTPQEACMSISPFCIVRRLQFCRLSSLTGLNLRGEKMSWLRILHDSQQLIQGWDFSPSG